MCATCARNYDKELRPRIKTLLQIVRHPPRGRPELISRGGDFFYIILCGISTHAICRGGLPIVARKFIRKILAAAVALWWTRFRWCGGARRRAVPGGMAATQNRSRTDRCGAVQSRAKSITHPPVRAPPGSIPPVCQSRRGVIGDAECANCRRSTTWIYRAGVAADSPSRRTCVRIKTHLDGTIVNAISQ